MKKFALMVLSLTMALIMLSAIFVPVAVSALTPGKHSDGIKTENKEINYVSLGDSMSNGLALPGYNISGYLEVPKDIYPAQFAAWLAGFEGEISNGQTVYSGSKGKVNLTQLATSGMRSEDLHYVLEVGTENAKEAEPYTHSQLINNGRWRGNYAEVYQTAVAEADIITMAVGNANIGVHMTDMLKQAVDIEDDGIDYSYATFENALELAGMNDSIKAVAITAFEKVIDHLTEYLPREMATKVADRVSYCVASYLINYEGAIERIVELNPDVEIIIVGLFNTLSKSEAELTYEGKQHHISLEKITRTLFEPVNLYLMSIASSKKEMPGYENVTFYYSETYGLETLSAIFNSDYTKEEAMWFLSRFVPEITETFFPALGTKLQLTDITVEEVYGYSFEREEFLSSLGNLDQNTKETKIYSIEIYKALEKAICSSIPLTPEFDLDAMGVKLDADIDLEAVAIGWVEEFFAGLDENTSPEELFNSIKGNKTMVSVLSLYGRVSLASGMSGHPCAEDHDKIFESVVASYLEGKTTDDASDEKLKDIFADGVITNYYREDDSYYTAIGKQGMVDIKDHYAAILANDLGINCEIIDNSDLRVSDLRFILDETYVNDAYGNAIMEQYDMKAVRSEYLSAIKKADLITLEIGSEDITTFALSQLMGYIVYEYADMIEELGSFCGAFGVAFPDFSGFKMYQMDWSRFDGLIDPETVDKLLADIRANLIESGVQEEQFVEIPMSELIGAELPPMFSGLAINFYVYPVDLAVYAAECYLYSCANYVYNYDAMVDQIHLINPDAELIILGGINAVDGMASTAGEGGIDIKEMAETVLKVKDLYSFKYALATPKTAFVDVKNAQTVLASQKENIELADLLNIDLGAYRVSVSRSAISASVEGNKYIYEQIRDSIVLCCEHAYDNDCDAVCNKCEESRVPADHVYDYECDTECNVCLQKRENVEHKYDNSCDKSCNVCGAERTPSEHVYDNACDKSCNSCGAERTPSEHVYDNACDKNCNTCQAERAVPDHVYTNDCDAECDVCAFKREPKPHIFENDCDEDCSVCGHKRSITHTYTNNCDAECDICGAQRTPYDHIYGEWTVEKEPTAEAEGVRSRSCVSCGEKVTESIPVSDDMDTDNSESTKTVVIVVIVVSVCVIGGVAAIVVVKRKI